MGEQIHKPEASENTSEKIKLLREQVAQLDKFLKDEDLSDADKVDLLDEREGLRLQAFADSLTESKLNPIPDIDDELVVYLRPSMRQELDKLIEQTTDMQLAEKLATIKSVIDKDAAFKLVHQSYASNNGEGVDNSVYRVTGINPKPLQ